MCRWFLYGQFVCQAGNDGMANLEKVKLEGGMQWHHTGLWTNSRWSGTAWNTHGTNGI